MTVLEIKNLGYKYENTKRPVISNINMKFDEGKVYCIIGKSGSGKSTLLSLLAGLDSCTEGEILFNGVNIDKIDRDIYRSQKIGVIFQGYNLLLNTNAIENIALSMDISKTSHKNKNKYILNLLQSVGISKEKATRKVLSISGGEQQRVGIARALSHKPDIILADEPTGNLDSETEVEIINLLVDLAHKQNKCVIIVTHSKKVTNYADEVWGINKNGDLLLINDSNEFK